MPVQQSSCSVAGAHIRATYILAKSRSMRARAKDLATPATVARDTPPEDTDKADRRRPSFNTILCAVVLLLGFSLISFRFGVAVGETHERKSTPTPLMAARLDALEGFANPRAGSGAHSTVMPKPQDPLLVPPSPPPLLSRLSKVEEEIMAAPDNEKQTCLSFNREMCPPLNLSIQTEAEQRSTHKRCGAHVRLERGFFDSKVANQPKARFCGRRLPRLNPCWTEHGTTSCLPHFFLLGEMKCGTTSLYNFLQKHPR